MLSVLGAGVEAQCSGTKGVGDLGRRGFALKLSAVRLRCDVERIWHMQTSQGQILSFLARKRVDWGLRHRHTYAEGLV